MVIFHLLFPYNFTNFDASFNISIPIKKKKENLLAKYSTITYCSRDTVLNEYIILATYVLKI